MQTPLTFVTLVVCCVLVSCSQGHPRPSYSALKRTLDKEDDRRSMIKRLLPVLRSLEHHQPEFPSVDLDNLTCEVFYFPWPNNHVFCCKKNNLCECPHPMGICATPEQVEEAGKEAGSEDEDEEDAKEGDDEGDSNGDDDKEEKDDGCDMGSDDDDEDCDYSDLFNHNNDDDDDDDGGCKRKRCLRVLMKIRVL